MDFEQGGKSYRVRKLDARSQFNIVKRLAPFLGAVVPVVQDGASSPADAVKALGNALADMPDDRSDHVLFGLLAAVTRKQEGGLGYAPVCNGTVMVYDDVDLVGMLTLAWQALSFNLSGFFDALPSGLKEAIPKRAESQSNG